MKKVKFCERPKLEKKKCKCIQEIAVEFVPGSLFNVAWLRLENSLWNSWTSSSSCCSNCWFSCWEKHFSDALGEESMKRWVKFGAPEIPTEKGGFLILVMCVGFPWRKEDLRMWAKEEAENEESIVVNETDAFWPRSGLINALSLCSLMRMRWSSYFHSFFLEIILLQKS